MSDSASVISLLCELPHTPPELGQVEHHLIRRNIHKEVEAVPSIASVSTYPESTNFPENFDEYITFPEYVGQVKKGDLLPDDLEFFKTKSSGWKVEHDKDDDINKITVDDTRGGTKTFLFQKHPYVCLEDCDQEAIDELRDKYTSSQLKAWINFNELAERALKKKSRTLIPIQPELSPDTFESLNIDGNAVAELWENCFTFCRFMRNLYSDELQNDHDQKHPSRKYKFKDSPAEICRCDKPDYPGGMLKHEPNCFAKVLLLALADGPAEKSWSKLSATTDRMLTKAAQIISINEASKATEQGRDMRRLTWLTIIFMPSSTFASWFGMNIRELGSNKIPWYIAAVVGIALYVLMFIGYIALPLIRRMYRSTTERWHNKLHPENTGAEEMASILADLVEKKGHRSDMNDSRAPPLTEHGVKTEDEGLIRRMKRRISGREKIDDLESGKTASTRPAHV